MLRILLLAPPSLVTGTLILGLAHEVNGLLHLVLFLDQYRANGPLSHRKVQAEGDAYLWLAMHRWRRQVLLQLEKRCFTLIRLYETAIAFEALEVRVALLPSSRYESR